MTEAFAAAAISAAVVGVGVAATGATTFVCMISVCTFISSTKNALDTASSIPAPVTPVFRRLSKPGMTRASPRRSSSVAFGTMLESSSSIVVTAPFHVSLSLPSRA